MSVTKHLLMVGMPATRDSDVGMVRERSKIPVWFQSSQIARTFL